MLIRLFASIVLLVDAFTVLLALTGLLLVIVTSTASASLAIQ